MMEANPFDGLMVGYAFHRQLVTAHLPAQLPAHGQINLSPWEKQ